MNGVISLFIVFILWTLIASIRYVNANLKKSRKKDSVTSHASFDVNQHVAQVVERTKAISAQPIKERQFCGLEDRSNDWLAKQIAYERSIRSVLSDMFMLKDEHSKNCDAFDLKMEHYINCDARANEEVYKGEGRMSPSEMEDLKERIRQRRS